MRIGLLLNLAALWLLTIPACQQPASTKLDEGLVQSMTRPAVDNAIVTQHTLYPYHFVPESDQLNELGESDLLVLITHYQQTPGELNIRRGSESEALYRARVETVTIALSQAGLDMQRVAIRNELPGGDGMSSDRVQRAMERSQTPTRFTPADGVVTPLGNELLPGGEQ